MKKIVLGLLVLSSPLLFGQTIYSPRKNPVFLTEQSANPGTSSNRGVLYTFDVGGVTELRYSDSDGNITTITSGGGVNAGEISLSADSVNDTHVDWGTGANQVSQDDVVDGSTFKQFNPASVAITGGSVTGITDLTVADGGTGASTLTDGGILLGSGTDPVTALGVAGAGFGVVGDGTTDPQLVELLSKNGASLNLAIASATTTNANDSIEITGQEGTALSSTNPGFIALQSATSGQLSIFQVTSDVTILLTGAHWGRGTLGDITGALLRVLAVNDNGTLRWCIAYLGGRETLVTTDTNATQTSITTPESALCNTAVASATNYVADIGYVRSNFDDTGGAAEDLWANQTGVGDIITGRTADGLWQPWNVALTGFDPAPTVNVSRWTQDGLTVKCYINTSSGTSNATTLTFNAPVKMNANAGSGLIIGFANTVDNSSELTTPGAFYSSSSDSVTISVLKNTSTASTWTASNAKGFTGLFEYEANF